MFVNLLEDIERHVKTHSERSAEDKASVAVLEYFLRSNGKINTNFASNDKWPNTDGTFEIVPNPGESRKPTQNFIVQIKGTANCNIGNDGIIRYQLQSLAFPAYIAKEVTLDPGILFIVINPQTREKQRVFWKYISPAFLASIDFKKGSVYLSLQPTDEIFNSDDSINSFVNRLVEISENHSFVMQLERREFKQEDIIKVILARSNNINDAIEAGNILSQDRDTKVIDDSSLIILAGDIYQIESIEFGNWFFYAKDILPKKSVVELTSTWRTKSESLKNLWEEVRFKQPLITEKLVIDGPFSEQLGSQLFTRTDDDEVVLCLNYDGHFGLNSINEYFQEANPSKDVFTWEEWKFKKGDPILFNENVRFPMLYNNLKGEIIDISAEPEKITFLVDVDILLTDLDFKHTDCERISSSETKTRIRFSVNKYDNSEESDIDDSQINSIIPFQLAYAVSIHKAQGLEYNSIKIVIPDSVSERITHGIFYTAITRAKEKLKIFWSAETMQKIIKNFEESNIEKVSLEKIKAIIQSSR